MILPRMHLMSKKHFFAKALVSSILIFPSLSLHAALFDDMVEKIEAHIPAQTKHHHRHRYHRHTHRYHMLSQEAQWQSALKFLGYYQGKINGDLFTQSFFNAVTVFHEDHGEVATGFLEEADKRYLTKVYHTVALEKYLSYEGKNRRKKAQKLQAALSVLSFYNGKIDGSFKKHSKEALTQYSLQYDGNATQEEIRTRLVNDAKRSIKEAIEKIKKEGYDPSAYAKSKEENLSISL